MKRRRQRSEKPALELIEEAAHLLRQAPVSTLALYYIGSLPFMVGLLYYWAEMSRSPFASQHLVGESLGLALLFLWMKAWQSRFARNLWNQIGGHSRNAFGWRTWWHLVIGQSALQATGLFVLPLALVLTVPFGWVYAFYQALTTLDEAEKPGLRGTFDRAWREAMLWQGQNHRLLLIFFGFGTFVFLNWAIVSLALPALLKIFLGVETVFTRSPIAVMNSTFFASMVALTYLSVDPLIKAVYTLRCFYGEARSSGADIKAELRQIAVGANGNGNGTMVILSLVIFGLIGAGTSGAAVRPEGTTERAEFTPLSSLRNETIVVATANDSTSSDGAVGSLERPLQSSSVPPPELDKQIGETLKESKYTWRFPRDTAKKSSDSEKGMLGRFMERAGKWLESMRDWIADKLRKWLRPRSSMPHSSSGLDWMIFVQFLFYLLIAVVVIGAGFLIYYLVSKRGQKQAAIESVPIQPAPDVSDENVGAEQLPEDGWLRLGRELLQKGELRLALRAFYLSSLANLASRNLINLARFKSNRDYQRELERRAHSFPQVLALFGDNVTVFDRIWYGMYETTPDLVNQFLAKVERINAGAEG
jgi:hypothetical protein